jgi:protein-disulfide isomerase
MNNKMLWGVLATIAIFGFLTIVYMATSSTGPAPVFESTKTLQPSDHLTWSPSKKHILTEYGDFQCPACGAFYQYIQANVANDKDITDNVTLVFRHFPLTSLHKHAMEAALAAEAAGKQGKFFQMGDMLFTTQASWGESGDVTSTFQGFAKKLNLNMDKFNADIKSKAVKDAVNNDINSGNQVAVNSTPTFFLDGVKVNVASYDEFKNLLLDAAKK